MPNIRVGLLAVSCCLVTEGEMVFENSKKKGTARMLKEKMDSAMIGQREHGGFSLAGTFIT